MLALTHASIATVEELFRYKKQDFQLEDFPGYTPDQWGIKAHNRPWVEEVAKFNNGQKILEVGGAYSLFPKYLSEKYDLEAWIGDDFGTSTGDSLWSRWGNPNELPKKYPSIKYVFEPFGRFSNKYPDKYFDRIFSISTLEHIPFIDRLNVFKDMNRCLKPGGMQMHTIDISVNLKRCILNFFTDPFPIFDNLSKNFSEIRSWIKIMKNSGVKIATGVPNSIFLLEKFILVESPDVVYRFYPPMNEPKPYNPSASLLLIIEDI